MKVCEVHSHSRLHLGFLDLHGGLGRKYGSIGVALEKPCMVLSASESPFLDVEGDDAGRARAYAERFYAHCNLPEDKRARLSLKSALPAHVGLGSGTQLALTLGTALKILHGFEYTTGELALMMGRGKRSGAGIALFDKGGLVLDGGHATGRSRNVPPVLWQEKLPGDWLFVVAIPDAPCGKSGEKENGAFRNLPEPSPESAGQVCRHVLMGLIPAIRERDIQAFGRSLTAIQRIVGDCFSPAQSGRFACPFSEKVISMLREGNAAGVGQSSWGPTVYGLVEGKSAADELAAWVKRKATGLGNVEVFVSAAATRGAWWKIEQQRGSSHGD
ncbi:MAG: beta-ribofuranosylaminobenzene 5'-phosphate synthase family protein [Thermovirgaceae bacterium]